MEGDPATVLDRAGYRSRQPAYPARLLKERSNMRAQMEFAICRLTIGSHEFVQVIEKEVFPAQCFEPRYFLKARRQNSPISSPSDAIDKRVNAELDFGFIP